MPDVDMSNSDTIKISGVAYTKAEARILFAIANKWLNKNAAEQLRALDATPCVECGGVEFTNWQECKNEGCGCMRLRQ